MKTKTLGLFAIPIIAAIMIAWAPSTAYAGADPPFGTSAEVIKDGVCSVPGADADGNMIPGGASTDYVKVISNSATGHIVLKCIKTDGTNESGKAQVFKGFDCNIAEVGNTDDTKAIVSASGHVVMTCKYNVPQGGS